MVVSDVIQMNKKGIYKISLGDKFYIGQTKTRFIDRWDTHIREAHERVHVNKELEKMILNGASFEVLECIDDTDKIRDIESKYISNNCTNENMVNIQRHKCKCMDEAFLLFLQWFSENWTERLIYTKEHKKEIADKALEFGVRKVDRKKHTFQSLIKMIEERSPELIFLNNGKLLRKNNELVEKYKNLNAVESDRISPYIVVNTDRYKQIKDKFH